MSSTVKKSILSDVKAADAAIDKEVAQFKKMDSHLTRRLNEENQKVEALQKKLEVEIKSSFIF